MTAQLLTESGETIDDLPILEEMEVSDLSRWRLELEDRWFKVLEKRYAQDQVNQWKDILEYLRALTKPIRRGSIIPQGEGAAYFEWAIWRAFLAINSLVNKPREARRFRIDQDFLPLGPAPGNGPDMIFKFDNFVIVVEVTLTQSSRQEAAEGEPVADMLLNSLINMKNKANGFMNYSSRTRSIQILPRPSELVYGIDQTIREWL